jgi:hypothetical protein
VGIAEKMVNEEQSMTSGSSFFPSSFTPHHFFAISSLPQNRRLRWKKETHSVRKTTDRPWTPTDSSNAGAVVTYFLAAPLAAARRVPS